MTSAEENATSEDRLAALEARLRRAEDHLEILNLVNSYGPLVDSGWADEAPKLWADGGVYDVGLPDGSTSRLEKGLLQAMFESESHMAFVHTGLAHLNATPKVTIAGDTASAVGYSFVILRENDRWFVWRAAVNEWSLIRTHEGWRIAERVNRTLDGLVRESRRDATYRGNLTGAQFVGRLFDHAAMI